MIIAFVYPSFVHHILTWKFVSENCNHFPLLKRLCNNKEEISYCRWKSGIVRISMKSVKPLLWKLQLTYRGEVNIGDTLNHNHTITQHSLGRNSVWEDNAEKVDVEGIQTEFGWDGPRGRWTRALPRAETSLTQERGFAHAEPRDMQTTRAPGAGKTAPKRKSNSPDARLKWDWERSSRATRKLQAAALRLYSRLARNRFYLISTDWPRSPISWGDFLYLTEQVGLQLGWDCELRKFVR